MGRSYFALSRILREVFHHFKKTTTPEPTSRLQQHEMCIFAPKFPSRRALTKSQNNKTLRLSRSCRNHGLNGLPRNRIWSEMVWFFGQASNGCFYWRFDLILNTALNKNIRSKPRSWWCAVLLLSATFKTKSFFKWRSKTICFSLLATATIRQKSSALLSWHDDDFFVRMMEISRDYCLVSRNQGLSTIMTVVWKKSAFAGLWGIRATKWNLAQFP